MYSIITCRLPIRCWLPTSVTQHNKLLQAVLLRRPVPAFARELTASFRWITESDLTALHTVKVSAAVHLFCSGTIMAP